MNKIFEVLFGIGVCLALLKVILLFIAVILGIAGAKAALEAILATVLVLLFLNMILWFISFFFKDIY